MAKIVPSNWKALHATGAASREIETLNRLAAGLPAAYTVYHGVHWTRLKEGFTIFGEADFVVVSPAGAMAVIEQKAGFLSETPEGLAKPYSGRTRNVAVQLSATVESLARRLTDAFGAGSFRLEGVLYCPDYTVRNSAIAGVDPARIIDATRSGRLSAILQQILPADETPIPHAAKLHKFLRDELALAPDASAQIGDAGAWVTRLSGGLATWARRLAFEPFRLRVIGTAGSGKTQLALKVIEDAVSVGRRALYVCYNRPLADHITQVSPAGAAVSNYHQLCVRALRELGREPDFSQPGAFQRFEAEFAAQSPPPGWQFDELIIDEGQDFRQEWVEPLLRLLAPGGRAWWLEDPMQNLYLRESVALPGWTVLRATTNYRSPRDILQRIREMVGPAVTIEPGSPFGGSDVVTAVYADAAGVADETKRAITHALGLGFRRQDIAVLSWHGREHSALAAQEQLGPYRMRSFTGGYDLLGNPDYREGDVLFESIYRFKGQAAPCVILTEIDFEALDEQTTRKLFVGATRATMKLMMVFSERAAALLDGALPMAARTS
jgi:hypothetical protein